MPVEPLTAVPGTSVPTGSLISPGGEQGVSGAPGPQGPQGPTGPQGIPGADSTVPGPQGPAGPTGPTGAAGTTGATGAQGPQGLPGNDGAPGATGAQGAKGDPGTPGAIGAQGPQGVKGDPGSTGQTGAQGPPGTTGAQGPKGDTGTAGSQGIQGVQGNPGTPGEQWFSGSGVPSTALGVLNDWYLNSANGDFYEKTAASTWTLRGNLKGVQGAQGIQGPTGNTGSQGIQGIQGPQGNPGSTGATGSQGPAGPGLDPGGTVGQIVRKVSSTDYDTEWKTPASLQSAAVTPALPVSAALRHTGIGGSCLITPNFSGKLLITIACDVMAPQASGVFQFQGQIGTGAAPAAGAAIVGTRIGIAYPQCVAQGAFVITGLVTGLPIGVQHWIDLTGQRLSGTGGTMGATNVTAVELP